MSKYVVGAYPASPAHRNWDPEAEANFFELLSTDPRIGSLEIPWLGQIHPHDTAWLHNNFPSNLSAVITSIPFVMGQLSKDATYGLASNLEEGREKAINDVKNLLGAINKLHDNAGRKIATVVEIHTAPRETGSAESLAKSLEIICNWNWDGVEIVIEHCDAFVPGQTPEKGFLSLQQEISAIKASETGVGIFINWGRSAIEFRDASRVVEHIQLAKESGLLRGLIFSGASAKQGLFGYPWIDAHHPFQKNIRHEFGDLDSLLTEELAASALRVAGNLPWLGIKMGWPSEVPGSLNQRYQMISAALDVLDAHNHE